MPSKLSIKINNINLKKVETCKYLFIIFHYNMRRDKQIKSIVSTTTYLEMSLYNVFFIILTYGIMS